MTIGRDRGPNAEENEKDTNICRLKCQYPCERCEKNQCSKCFPGFKLNETSNQCLPDYECNPFCEFCPPGTEVTTDKNGYRNCVSCGVENCSSCWNGDCLSCFDGYYLDQSNRTCLPCANRCKVCLDGDTCEMCGGGTYREIAAKAG